MGELINGRTAEEIKRVLAWTNYGCGGIDCECCSYRDVCSHENARRVTADALALIERLEAAQPRWISVEEMLPEDCKDVLVWAVYHEEYGRNWALREIDEYCKGVGWMNTADPDVRDVTHWMPLPSVEELK